MVIHGGRLPHLLERLLQTVPAHDEQPVHLLSVVQKPARAQQVSPRDASGRLSAAPVRLELRPRAVPNHVAPRLALLVAPHEEQGGAEHLGWGREAAASPRAPPRCSLTALYSASASLRVVSTAPGSRGAGLTSVRSISSAVSSPSPRSSLRPRLPRGSTASRHLNALRSMGGGSTSGGGHRGGVRTRARAHARTRISAVRGQGSSLRAACCAPPRCLTPAAPPLAACGARELAAPPPQPAQPPPPLSALLTPTSSQWRSSWSGREGAARL